MWPHFMACENSTPILIGFEIGNNERKKREVLLSTKRAGRSTQGASSSTRSSRGRSARPCSESLILFYLSGIKRVFEVEKWPKATKRRGRARGVTKNDPNITMDEQQ